MHPRLSRRHFLTGAVSAAALVGLYANEVGRHELEVTQRTFFIRNLPPAFHGFRIVQFSDIHLEEFTEDFYLRRVIAQVNQLAGDLVLVTGDYCSRGPMSIAVSLAAAARCAQLLAGLTTKERYGILGNHDAFVGPRIIRDHMENNGLPLLVNQNVRIERDNQHIFLAGIDDYSAGIRRSRRLSPTRPMRRSS